MSSSPRPDPPRVCVVGGGPAGLALARALTAHGVAFDGYERHTDVGGLWDQDNPGSPVYDSAHFISSKTQSHFHDHPMPPDYPDYPSHRQVLAYMRGFADTYGLREHYRLGVGVRSAVRSPQGWLVTTTDGDEHRYSDLVAATGTNWHPNLPSYPGTFTGELRHSQTYRSRAEFDGRRVLVVGGGNSGVDIACDAATSASRAGISLRRGYHFIPKHLFGVPSDAFAARGPALPIWLEQRVFGALLRLLTGDLRRLGLPRPDHRLFESHPIMNTQLLHHLAHGDVTAYPDVARFDGRTVHFVDGRSAEFDLVIAATGYRWDIPWLEATAMPRRGGRPDLYLNLFSRTDPHLYALGYAETNGGAYKLFDDMADLVTRAVLARRAGGAAARRVDDLVRDDRPDLTGGIHFVGSDRHATYLELTTYRRQLARVRGLLGWPALQPGTYDALRRPAPVRAVVP